MIHIQNFIEQLQGCEARQQRDYVMSVKDAKNLHADITRLLLTLERLREDKPQEEPSLTVNMTGGTFK